MIRGLVALALSGTFTACYVGVQSTSSIVQSDGIGADSSPPNSTLSHRVKSYELTGGYPYRGFEFFGGAGFGDHGTRVRTRSQATTHSDFAMRIHAGVSLPIASLDRIKVRAFAIYATQAISLFSDDIELTRLKRSLEGGLQVSTKLNSDSYYIEPLFRLGVAAQTGATEPGIYQNRDGGQSFDGLAVLATIGINFGLGGFLDD